MPLGFTTGASSEEDEFSAALGPVLVKPAPCSAALSDLADRYGTSRPGFVLPPRVAKPGGFFWHRRHSWASGSTGGRGNSRVRGIWALFIIAYSSVALRSQAAMVARPGVFALPAIAVLTLYLIYPAIGTIFKASLKLRTSRSTLQLYERTLAVAGLHRSPAVLCTRASAASVKG